MRIFHESRTRWIAPICVAAAGLICFSTGVSRECGAATTGTSNVVLNADAVVEINIQTPTLTFNPTQSNYESGANGIMKLEGTSGIDVQVRSNCSTGFTLAVKCVDASPEIHLADLLFRTTTPPGGSGTNNSTYTAMGATDQVFWTSSDEQPTYVDVYTDIEIQNLWSYTDAGGAGKTAYTDQLTFTAAVQ